MIVDYEYRNKRLIISYIDDYGNIKMKYYPWENPTKFIVTHDTDPEKDPKYKTWDGKAVKTINTNHPNRYSIYDFMDALPEEDKSLIFDYKDPNIFFIDIETEMLDKFVEPNVANSEIQTISIVNKDKVLVLGSRPLGSSESKSIEGNINNHFDKLGTEYKFMYKEYKSEYDMLLNFFKVLVPKMAVLTGWNFIHYDWVFLVTRARNIGIDPSVASFTNVLREAWDSQDYSEMPAHRIIVDYMELYEKWDTSIKIKESKALDFVSENVLGMKKVNYEGNLKHLYNTDYTKFVLYNAIDSALVQQIHLKMRYVDILYGVSTLSRIKVTDGFSTLPVTEGILRREMRDQKNIIFAKDPSNVSNGGMSVKGGWVKDPVVGMNTWTCCFDFASLYPTTIREFNQSADSYKGQVVKERGCNIMDMIYKLHKTDEEVYSIHNGKKILLTVEDTITLNGAVFKKEIGVVKKVMGDIYKERKKYKKVMMKANEDMNEMKAELKLLEQDMNM